MKPTQDEQGKKINYDPTITLGNILTLIGVLGALFAAYAKLESRIAVLEVEITQQKETDRRIERDSIAAKVEINSRLVRLEDKIDALLRLEHSKK
jgi:beta-lactamase regulating signal transducer with metallopeptidase domain